MDYHLQLQELVLQIFLLYLQAFLLQLQPQDLLQQFLLLHLQL